MADKRLTYELTTDDRASAGFSKVAASASGSANDISKAYKKSSDDSKLHVSALTAAIAGVAPAAVPIGAVAVGALAGLGASAGVALLGVLGIRDAMKQGTVLGQQYTAAFKPIISEFEHLKQLSAQNMFDGISMAVRSSQSLFPVLNRDVAILATQVGQIVGHVGPGLVALFGQLNPLLTDLGGQLVAGSAKFQQWAQSSDMVGKFVAYAQNQLPAVEHTLGEVATTVVHLVQGLAPLGSTSLSTIGALAKVINTIPVGVLQAVVPVIGSLVLGLKGLELARGAAKSLEGLSGKLSDTGGFAGRASGTVSKFGKFVGFLGPAGVVASIGVGLLSSALGSQAQKQAEATAQVNDYTQALQASNGAINENVRTMVAKNLQDSGAFDAAKKLGIGIDQVTAAVFDNTQKTAVLDELQRRFPDSMEQTAKAAGMTWEQYKALYLAANDLGNALNKQSGEVDKAKAKQQELAASTQTATSMQNTSKVAIDGVSAAMDKQTTAASLLKTAFDRLNGTSLSVEQTENSFLDTLGQLKKAHDAGTSSISQNSTAGRANREVIVQAITAANQAAQAIADQTAKTKGLSAGAIAGAASLKQHEDAIRRAAAAAGLDKAQVDALINTLGRVPKVTTNRVDTNASFAAAQVAALNEEMNRLHSRSLSIDITQTIRTIGGTAFGGRLAGNAAGTENWRGGMTLVGEQGPELVSLPAGSKIDPAARTRQKLATGGGGDTYVTVNVGGSVIAQQDMAREVVAAIDLARKRAGGRGSVLNL